MPNLVDLVQHGKARALTLYLGEDLIGEESELVALKEQHVPISFDLDELRQLSRECFFDHLIEICTLSALATARNFVPSMAIHSPRIKPQLRAKRTNCAPTAVTASRCIRRNSAMDL